jgi:hypothetical protein
VPAAALAVTYGAMVLPAAARAAMRLGLGGGLGLLVVIPIMHVGYGLGYLRGLLDHFVLTRRGAPASATVALSR